MVYILALGKELTTCNCAHRREGLTLLRAGETRTQEGSGSHVEQIAWFRQITGKANPVMVPQPAGQTLSSRPGLLEL